MSGQNKDKKTNFKDRVNPRSILARRRDTMAQLRKQRKEATLQRRRRLPSSASQQPISRNDVQSTISMFVKEPTTLQSCQMLLSMLSSPSSNAYLASAEFLKNHEPQAALLIHKVIQEALINTESTEVCLQVLLDLSSLSTRHVVDTDAYYGQAPTTWSTLLVQWKDNLVSLLSLAVSRPVVYHILGNLVLESPEIRERMRTEWALLTHNLPDSLYLMTTIVQRDSTTYGSFFLQSLSPDHLCRLFQDTSLSQEAAIDAVWLLEGLVRREPECIIRVCEHVGLIQAFLQRVMAPSATNSLLCPALSAISYVSVAFDGKFIISFLFNHEFMQFLTTLLRQRRLLDTVTLSKTFLYDFGTPNHPSTTIANQMLPILLDIVTANDTTLDWKREAALTLCIALDTPPVGAAPEVVDILVRTLRALLFHEEVISLLFELSAVQDADAALASLKLLDRLFRNVPESLAWLRKPEHVNALYLVMDRYDNIRGRDGSIIFEIACGLLNDFVDDVEDEADVAGFDLAPVAAQGAFSFGASASTEPTRSMGRGRGRTAPSWMK